MAQKRRKNRISGKTVRKIIIFVLILAVIILLGMRYLKKKVSDNFAQQPESNVQTTQVTTGSISTTVTGSGTLADEESEKIEIPSSVTLNEVYVSTGDQVEEGDLLATVDSASVLSSMSDFQSQIDELDEELAEAEDDSASGTVKATVSGRVKAIQAQAGDDVASTMYEKGSLILLSLDGFLAVDVNAGNLTEDEEVSVKVGDTTYTGTVDTILNQTATVLISDKSAAVDEEATVLSGDTEIGSGSLYIHESLAVTGYVGTVKEIKTKVNAKVSQGDTLMTLKDTSYSANYTAILKERNELEEKLQDLIVIYKKGAVYATCAGTITEATDNSETITSSQAAPTAASFGGSGTSTATTADTSSDSVFAICPNQEMLLTVNVDESDISSVSEGQEAAVTVSSISDTSFPGTVTSIETSGTSSNGVTTYSVDITLQKEASMLSGMSASASITIEGVENALLLPADAVTKTRDTAYVYTNYDEESDTLGGMVEVQTGISNNSYIEITGGLSEGDTVYYKESSDAGNFSFGNFGGGFNGGNFDPGNMPSGGGKMPSGDGGGMSRSGNFGGGSMPPGNSGN
ncbi:MAG: HlyD family efflux transporter periplasmic adaptor subunit [Oliverpabstia sp.]